MTPHLPTQAVSPAHVGAVPDQPDSLLPDLNMSLMGLPRHRLATYSRMVLNGLFGVWCCLPRSGGSNPRTKLGALL